MDEHDTALSHDNARLQAELAQAQADAAAVYQQIEDVRSKAAPLSVDDEWVTAYIIPSGTLHVLFGMARGRRDGNRILAELEKLRNAKE